jgi:hypothetical protein
MDNKITAEEYRDRIINIMKEIENFVNDKNIDSKLRNDADKLYLKIDNTLMVYPSDLSLENVMKIEMAWKVKYQNIKNKVN